MVRCCKSGAVLREWGAGAGQAPCRLGRRRQHKSLHSHLNAGVGAGFGGTPCVGRGAVGGAWTRFGRGGAGCGRCGQRREAQAWAWRARFCGAVGRRGVPSLAPFPSRLLVCEGSAGVTPAGHLGPGRALGRIRPVAAQFPPNPVDRFRHSGRGFHPGAPCLFWAMPRRPPPRLRRTPPHTV